jgi:hypothetical protein
MSQSLSTPIYRRRFHRLALVGLFSLSVLGGCANHTTSLLADKEPQAPKLLVTFKTPDLQAQLEEMRLLEPLTTYWSYYVQRKWKERFAMERFQNLTLTVEVYESYYAHATKLKAIEVTALYKDEKGRIRAQLQTNYESRENPAKTDSFLLSDWWERNESQQWQHLNHDPILHKGRVTP